jgi:hypothetical protein
MVDPVLRKRLRARKAVRVARLLVELDDAARDQRFGRPRRTLRASLGGAR